MPFRARRVANALAPLRRGQGFRQYVAATSFPGMGTSLCVQPTLSQTLHRGWSSSGFTGCILRKSYLEPAQQPSLRPRRRFHGTAHPTRIGDLDGFTSDDEHIDLFYKLPSRPGDSRQFRMSKLYLRDACQCAACVSPSSGLKAFATCDVPAVPRLSQPEYENTRLNNGSLEVTWENDFLTHDKHISVYPLDFLRRLVAENGRAHVYTQPARTLWDSAIFKAGMQSRFISYSDWMRDGPAFAAAVFDILKYGLLFIRDVPDKRKVAELMAHRIGPLQDTSNFLQPPRQISSRSARRLRAHDSDVPCLHQDLLYVTDAPKLQFIHCIENNCDGGELLFSDGARAAWELKHTDPINYEILTKHLVTFQFCVKDRYLSTLRPVISKSQGGDPNEISWAPPFQGPFGFSEHLKPFNPHPQPRESRAYGPRSTWLSSWSKASRALRDTLEASQNVVQYRLRPGECVIMDNRRILNGWTAYDTAAGHRMFRGAYIDRQILNSTLVKLDGKGMLPRRVGWLPNESKQSFAMLYPDSSA